ncbi:hypothetical protein [Actinomadura rugatobispora]|uniref:Uncharacterized protein n=1 Tax=Actinomadura rugatobispora TaxID=1994 RepID=A0ABW1AIG8_9ACTN|nr:hypothetical protein GCM10010200_066080 [Actinomadura rugatobispora]
MGATATQYIESDSETSAKGALVCGLLAIASAMIAAGALNGMTPPAPKVARFVPPGAPPQAAQPQAQPQAQPYSQPATPPYGAYGGQPQQGGPQAGPPQQPGPSR